MDKIIKIKNILQKKKQKTLYLDKENILEWIFNLTNFENKEAEKKWALKILNKNKIEITKYIL